MTQQRLTTKQMELIKKRYLRGLGRLKFFSDYNSVPKTAQFFITTVNDWVRFEQLMENGYELLLEFKGVPSLKNFEDWHEIILACREEMGENKNKAIWIQLPWTLEIPWEGVKYSLDPCYGMKE